MKIIIDTDPGHDDAMALMLALKSPELEVLAITTVAGNSTIENTTRNARFILNALGRNEIPVYSGAGKPLKRSLRQAVVHGKSGLAGIDPTGDADLTNDAADRIIELVAEYPGELVIVTLGPLTNIAQAIRRNPDIMLGAKQIISMGGALAVPGNMNRVAEFNIFVDPEAADIVFGFEGIEKVIVPLDACNHVHMTIKDFERITNPALRTILITMLRPYIKNIREDTGVNAALMYDPLTVFFLLQPESCQTALHNLQVETKGRLTRGMTVVDRRAVTDGLDPNVTAVTAINASDFIRRFIDTLSS